MISSNDKYLMNAFESMFTNSAPAAPLEYVSDDDQLLIDAFNKLMDTETPLQLVNYDNKKKS